MSLFDPAISRRIIALSSPVMLAMLSQTLINQVDHILVGHLPLAEATPGQTAVQISQILLWAFGGFLASISVGTQALAARRITPKDTESLDLSAWRVAGVGAEMIHPEWLEAFAEALKPAGFRPTSFLPSYGMAESTLAITFHPCGTDMVVDRVDASAMKKGLATPAAPGANADDPSVLELMSCGVPFPGHELRIVSETGEVLPERTVGHVLTRGPSVTPGYFENEDATREALVDGWLYTGDLGYLADGNLYICGRLKDLIIIHGRNYYPQDIEWVASQVEGVRRGNVIAFGLHHPELGREYVVVAAELHREAEASEELGARVQAQILAALALRVDEVVLLPPGSLPKTSSGKLQRSKGAEMFARGELGKGVGPASKLGLLKHLAASRWGFIKASLAGRGE